MRRILVLALGLALAAGLFISPADSAPEPMHITQQRSWFQTVEQQGHIVNDTGCSWDADDLMAIAAEGYLDSTFTIESCLIVDGVDHLIGIDFRAPKSRPFTATVTMANESATHTITYQSAPDGKYQRVKKCLLTPEHDADYVFPPIGNGYGYRTTLTYTMQLQVERRANDAVMQTTLVVPHSGHEATYCGTYYTIGNPWPHCEGDPFVDGRVCYQ